MAETTAEVIYSDIDRASVHLDTSAPPETRWAGELALFMLYAGHILADVGRKQWAMEWSAAWSEVDAEAAASFAAGDKVFEVWVEPLPPPGTARVGFAAWLFHSDEFGPGFFLLPDQRFWRLKIRAGRWRVRLRGYHYFMTSIPLLLHALLRANTDDSAQQERLLSAMKLIAALHRERRLRLPITWTEAVSIAAEREFGVLPA